jgi:hypothetical protein
MGEEEKGFVIKDRRSFDEKGDLRKDKEPEDEKRRTEPKKDVPQKEEVKRHPLPEVTFNSLILSLSSSALLHFGEIADPQSGEKKQDLDLAKHAIDTISMLKEKTEGNLTEEEGKFIEGILTDLKWRYVKAVK